MKKIKKIHIESELVITLAIFAAMVGMTLFPFHSESNYKELSVDILNAQTNMQISQALLDESISFPRPLPQESSDAVSC